MKNNKTVGYKIQTIRENKNMSRKEVAEQAGLSEEQVTRIEEDIDLPALAPLLKIARAMGVRLGTFLDDQEELGPVICRNMQKEKSISFSTNTPNASRHMEYYSLSKSKSNRHMERFFINIAPAPANEYEMSSHEGEEFIIVANGEIEINYGNETYVLKKGDSIYYDSIVPHHVHAYNNQTASILAVVYVPA